MCKTWRDRKEIYTGKNVETTAAGKGKQGHWRLVSVLAAPIDVSASRH